MLAHADSEGWVDMHPRAISEEVGLSMDAVNKAINELESPDIESRSPEEDGRRIVRLDAHRAWGWRIVNHGKYRSIRNEEDRREQNRLAQQRFRNKSKQPVSDSKHASAQSAQAEAEAEAEAVKPLVEYSTDFLTFWKAYPNKVAKGTAFKSWKKLKPPLTEVLKAIEWQKESEKWKGGFIKNPEAYINGRCWEDEPNEAQQPKKAWQ